jgi:hypothetical protein
MPQGALGSCLVIKESPKGLGFGAAAQAMAEQGRIIVVGGEPVGEWLWVRVPFSAAKPARIAP